MAAMLKPFDPYHLWLGIPPEEQPPDHYRLLGIARFESDSDVIMLAAHRQMAHVKTFALGPHVAASQDILNQLARAKLCLVNPQKRARYDASLREAAASAKPAARKGDAKPVVCPPPAPLRRSEPRPMPAVNAPPSGTRSRQSKVRTIRIGAAPDNDRVIDLPMISWHHAVIRIENDLLTIEDLNSTNGTAIGTRQNKIRRARLLPGDTVYLGSHAVPAAILLDPK
jgi:hypothetical protein